VDLANVVWLGGATGSGKSSIARELARRHDLQLYNIDHRTWTHSARSREGSFLTLSMDERWLVPAPDQLVERFIRAAKERLPLILEDLAALSAAPGAIVEGPQLIPLLIAAVAAPDQVLLLVPSEERQRATLAERGSMRGSSDPGRAAFNLHRRNVRLAELIALEAERLGYMLLRVDRSLEAMIVRAEAVLARALARLPRGGDLVAVRRFENEALATQVRLYRASGEAPDATPPLPFACECGRSGCTAVVELMLEAYDELGPAEMREPLRVPSTTGPNWRLAAGLAKRPMLSMVT
jgi:hypothetical protein